MTSLAELGPTEAALAALVFRSRMQRTSQTAALAERAQEKNTMRSNVLANVVGGVACAHEEKTLSGDIGASECDGGGVERRIL